MAWVLAIPLLPALAFVALAPLGRAARARARWLAVAAVSGSLALSVAAFLRVLAAGGGEHPAYLASTVVADLGGAPLTLGVRLDAVSSVMMLVVTIVGACVQVYSLAYMRDDDRIGWYYTVLSLFTAAMLTLVLANDFLLLYMSWEVMGLCSYLLIGFWHEKPEPRAASLKAFLTTRIGDVWFAIALVAMYHAFGTFEFETVLHGGNAVGPGLVALISLGLLAGAVGKSAQVPLHVWLPDAMAGPTPASALIHAATMVAAGVYLVGRSLPLFERALPQVLPVVLWIGTVTALVGALLAVVQHDLKKVLAYSTISQLGYMFMALGAGSEVAAFWHLATHAFFKSLLFLGAGAIIHGTHTQDIREMGGLRRSMPWTTAVFMTGALALAGVFPLAGFWSKDEILTVLLEGGHPVSFALALLTALLTAFYVGRVAFRVFGGEERTHGHEAEALMLAPMVLLAALTAGIGAMSPAFATFLGEHGRWPEPRLAGMSLGAALAGLALAWWVYGRGRVDTVALRARLRPLSSALESRLYFDDVYATLLVRPYQRACAALSSFDLGVVDGAVNGSARLWSATCDALFSFDSRVIDGAVNGLGSLVKWSGSRLRRLQAGRVQSYQRLTFAALVVLMAAAWLLSRGV